MNLKRKPVCGSGAVLAAIVCVGLVSLAPSAFAQSAAAGRIHAQKATKLAEQGRCAKAIPEYSKAYEILKDPAILFNRAECQRKLEHSEEALADYERFLVELPKAPNRDTVQTRIDELRTKLNMPTSTAKAVDKPTTSAPILDDAEDEAPAASAGGEKDLAWTPPAPAAGGVRLGADEAPVEEEDGGVSPWVWVGLGAVVVAAGAVAAILIVGKKDTDIPESGLGNFKF
ncbi:MAG: tetratricopeptide repeat protein [Deltaproteobacteria bacterium]|nr:tetratricopeptide repeat protein [Deltaproteobacteria bacterium]